MERPWLAFGFPLGDAFPYLLCQLYAARHKGVDSSIRCWRGRLYIYARQCLFSLLGELSGSFIAVLFSLRDDIADVLYGAELCSRIVSVATPDVVTVSAPVKRPPTYTVPVASSTARLSSSCRPGRPMRSIKPVTMMPVGATGETAPEVALSSPAAMFSSVDLPHPEGPIKLTNSPFLTVGAQMHENRNFVVGQVVQAGLHHELIVAFLERRRERWRVRTEVTPTSVSGTAGDISAEWALWQSRPHVEVASEETTAG